MSFLNAMFEDLPETVEVYVKTSSYRQIQKNAIYNALPAISGYRVITDKFPMGLFYEKREVLVFRSVGKRQSRSVQSL